jgi:hypothetical protein
MGKRCRLLGSPRREATMRLPERSQGDLNVSHASNAAGVQRALARIRLERQLIAATRERAIDRSGLAHVERRRRRGGR